MKKLFLGCLLGIGLQAFGQQDTLQAQIGDAADLLIIMKTPAAREEIRRLDMNKVVADMMSTLEKSDTRVATVRSYEKNEFTKARRQVFSKSYFNYFIGLSYAGSYNNPELGFMNSLYQYASHSSVVSNYWDVSYTNNVLASPYLSVSANKDLHLIQRQRVGLDLKMGAEPFFNYEKLNFARSNIESQFPTGIYKAANRGDMSASSLIGSQILDTIATASYDQLNNAIRYSIYDSRNNAQSYVSYPYNVLKAGVNLRFLPKFSVFNSQGKRLFSLAVGPTVGLNVIRKSVTRIDAEDTTSDPVLISGTKPSLYRFGLAGELGIGGISFFAQYVASGSKNSGQLANVAAENNIRLIQGSGEYRTHAVNFGLRFGK